MVDDVALAVLGAAVGVVGAAGCGDVALEAAQQRGESGAAADGDDPQLLCRS